MTEPEARLSDADELNFDSLTRNLTRNAEYQDTASLNS